MRLTMIIVTLLALNGGAQDKVIQPDPRCGQEMVKGAGVPRDCSPIKEGAEPPKATPAPSVVQFRVGPVTVNQSIQPIAADMAAMRLRLTGDNGDSIEIDQSRLGDPEYLTTLRRDLNASSVVKDYRHQLARVEDRIDQRIAQGKAGGITGEDAVLLSHVLLFDTVLATTPEAMRDAVRRHATRSGVKMGRLPIQDTNTCYTNFRNQQMDIIAHLFTCGGHIYNSSETVFAIGYASLCMLEWSLRNTASVSNYMQCIGMSVGGTYNGVTGKIGG